MCGIVAFLSRRKPAIQYLLNGITILQNRGYDSAGICTINKSQKFINTKYASVNCHSFALNILKEKLYLHEDNYIGIAHTRWSTCGIVNDQNAHPHLDYKNRVAIVHNGIIENYQEIKCFLTKKGIEFRSDTDTEVIVNLISYYLDEYCEIWTAINKAMSQLQGTWGVVILYDQDPDHIYVCKKGSPLLVAYDNDFTIVASESAAFSQYTNKYIVLRDNEIVKLGVEKQLLDYEFKIIEDLQEITLTPEPYPHWMLKEIFEQPTTSMRAINMGGRICDNYNVKLGGLSNHKEELLKIENLLIVASGTSYHAGLLGAKYFRYLKCFNTVNVIDAVEFILDDLPMNMPGIIVLSQSGETKDVHRVVELAKSHSVIIIGIINVVGSLISRESDCGIYLNAGREVAVASTKSFTSQVIVLALMALWFSQNKIEGLKYKRAGLIENIRNISLNFTDIIRNISTNIGDDLIERLKDTQHIFILGKGLTYPIAREGSLKIKEISYIHAESYSGGALKHGPFALIKQGMPILIIVLDNEDAEKMHIAAEEVKARGAYTIIITNLKKYNKSLYDYQIQIPDCGIMTSLMAILPIQYLAYKLALGLGYNPDFPRHLAKVCTTL